MMTHIGRFYYFRRIILFNNLSQPPAYTLLIILGFILTSISLSGCAGPPVRNALPVDLSEKATFSGLEQARVWSSDMPNFTVEFFETASNQEIEEKYSGVYNVPHNYLAISGGGAEGAFGAGLLAGWTVQGSRPEFSVVTGISTGALD